MDGDLNFYLVHSVYRILDAEIESHIQFTNSDIELVNYQYHPHIPYPVSV